MYIHGKSLAGFQGIQWNFDIFRVEVCVPNSRSKYPYEKPRLDMCMCM